MYEVKKVGFKKKILNFYIIIKVRWGILILGFFLVEWMGEEWEGGCILIWFIKNEVLKYICKFGIEKIWWVEGWGLFWSFFNIL